MKLNPEMRSASLLNPARVLTFPLNDDGRIPNSKFPLLILQGAVKTGGTDLAPAFEEMFEANGWTGTWRDGIYTYHHYHSNTHEVLGVYSGSATVQFGGERGVKHKLTAGDVVVIPAGVAHKNLGASSDFGVVGGYPGGLEPDMNYGRPDERPLSDENIARAQFPKADPIYGQDGPLLKEWKR